MKFCETIKLTPADIEEGLYLTETSKSWRTPEHMGIILLVILPQSYPVLHNLVSIPQIDQGFNKSSNTH